MSNTQATVLVVAALVAVSLLWRIASLLERLTGADRGHTLNGELASQLSTLEDSLSFVAGDMETIRIVARRFEREMLGAPTDYRSHGQVEDPATEKDNT